MIPNNNGLMDVVPVSNALYNELLTDNWPGTYDGQGLPCRVKHRWWWCLYCRTLKPHCMYTNFSGSDFCDGCEDLGCFALEIPQNDTDTASLNSDYDYFYDLENPFLGKMKSK